MKIKGGEMKNYKKEMVEKKVFKKMMCDMCGAESDEEWWEDNEDPLLYDGMRFDVQFSKHESSAIDGESFDFIKYDICPKCFDELVKMLKPRVSTNGE